MDVESALICLRPLADGVDPLTGELFDNDSPYQQAVVIRALYVAIHALEEYQTREHKRARQPCNAGMPWSEDEDRQLLSGHENGTPVSELANSHGRSQTAIEARLFKLGRLDEPPSIRR